jgi:hypothetical protein
VTARHLAPWLAVVVVGCATTWPDERGWPVPLSYSDNARAGDVFMDALTARRAGKTIAAPLVTPELQSRLRPISEALQRGELSAPRAQLEALRWGQAAFRRAVDAWVLDCAPGPKMSLPGELVDAPVVPIAYAASHFEPRSNTVVQCAIIVVSATASEGNTLSLPGAPPAK